MKIEQLENGQWTCDLPDIFDTICEKLRNKEPFAFSRFGDGELNAIFQDQPPNKLNADGHQYFPDMGKRLGEIVMSNPDYYMGLQPLGFRQRGNHILDISEGVDWVNADCLHNASIKGRLGEFMEVLEERNVWIVCPEHLSKWALNKGYSVMEVAPKNCWKDYDSCKKELLRIVDSISHKYLDTAKPVFLFCASMMSNVLIDDLYRLNPNNTYIDVGSCFDPYVGVHSRSYHKKLKI